MKTTWLALILPTILVSGCGSSPQNGTWGLAVVGNAAADRVHRTGSKHVCAQPGTRLDDFERAIEQAEHETGVDYVVPEPTNGIWQFQYQGKNTFYYGRFIREEIPPLENAPAFSSDEILEPAALAAKLKCGSDPVSSWLFGRFSENGRAAIADGSTTIQDLQEVIAHELTAIVYGPPIYDETRFQQATLRPQTKRLVDFHPKFQPSPGALETAQAALNRLLLEDAFPHELARKQRTPWTHYYIAIRN